MDMVNSMTLVYQERLIAVEENWESGKQSKRLEPTDSRQVARVSFKCQIATI